MHMPQRIRRRVHAAAVHTLRTHAASQSERSREEPRLANRSSPGVRECAAPLLLQEARPLRRLRRHRVLVRLAREDPRGPERTREDPRGPESGLLVRCTSSDAPVARGRLISRARCLMSRAHLAARYVAMYAAHFADAADYAGLVLRATLPIMLFKQATHTHGRVHTSLPACRHAVPPRPSPHTSQLCRPRSATRCSSAWRCESFSSTTSRSAKRRRRRPSRPRPPAPFAAPLCVIPCRRPPDVLPACGPRVVARPPRSSFSRAARFTFSTPPSTARDAGGIVGKRMVGVDDNAIISTTRNRVFFRGGL